MEPSRNQGSANLPGRENQDDVKEKKKNGAGCAAGEGQIEAIFPRLGDSSLEVLLPWTNVWLVADLAITLFIYFFH